MQENTLTPIKSSVSGNLVIPEMTLDQIDAVRQLEQRALQHEQVPIETQHVLHGGIYTRTIRIPAGVLIVGALIVIPTTITISGECLAYIGGTMQRVSGHAVIPASANRKQVFLAVTETFLSASCRTNAVTVEEAESELTPEVDHLLSRRASSHNIYSVSGE